MKCFLDGHVHVNCDLKILCAFFLFNKTSRCDDLVGKPNFIYQNEKTLLPTNNTNYTSI